MSITLPPRSDRLNFVKNLPVMNNDVCDQEYGIITKGHLCIDSKGGHGVCNGDSGGPLNYEKETGKYMTVGIASFVSGLGCESGKPHGSRARLESRSTRKAACQLLHDSYR